MFRLFVSDLDGTLFNSRQQISPANIAAIKRLQASGIEFIVNTGRDAANTLELFKDTGIEFGLICSNGATAHTADGTCLFEHMLPKPVVYELLNTLKTHGFTPVLFSKNGKISLGSRKATYEYMKTVMIPSIQVSHPDFVYTEALVHFFLDSTTFYDTIEDAYAQGEEILKVITHSLNPAALEALQKDMEAIDGLSVANTAPTDLEITSKEADKGKGLLAYAAYKGYAPEEIIAVGDSGNDYSMLSLPGIYGVAMANATDAVKSVCKEETKANTEDGVAALIEKILKDC